LKVIIIYFILITTIFAIKLTDGNYSVVENTVKGKKWKTRVELKIKNNKIVWVNIDMVTKGGKLRSQDEKYIKKVLEDTYGINPYIELPKEYIEKIKKIDDYKMSRVDTIAGATAISNKFNKMTMFLIKKSEDGKTGQFKGWFH
jgi:major membrane immunogen (membrane-anchored lipoprotein)